VAFRPGINLIPILGALLVPPALQACLFASWVNPNGTTLQSTMEIETAFEGFQVGGRSLGGTEQHFFDSTALFSFENGPPQGIAIQSFCAKEGTDCSGCTEYGLTDDFEFSRPSGLKTFSVAIHYTNGSQSDCRTFSARVTHLNDPPEPQ
jgi:hypothetical protein